MLVITVYFSYRYVRIMIKLGEESILPSTVEEVTSIWKDPNKAIDFPTYSKQKSSVIFYPIVLVIVLATILFVLFNPESSGAILLVLFYPLLFTQRMFNLFSLFEDGLLCGSRFIPWRRMKSFYFIRIVKQHRYYGFSDEVNQGYELKIKTKSFPISCLITTEETKEKLTRILKEHDVVEEVYTVEEMF